MWLFLGVQSAMTSFYTFDREKFDIPYFEFKYCYKLSNKDICMLFNIHKQLKLMEIEVHI